MAPDDARPETTTNTRRSALIAAAIGVVGGGIVVAFDGPIREAIRSIPLGGDVKRELETLQQFGDLATMVVVGAVIGLVHPWRFRRMLDWLVAAGVGAVAFGAMKILTGRLRPRIPHEGSGWIGPMGEFHLTASSDGSAVPGVSFDALHPYEFWRSGVYQSLSMPSTHTAHAAIAAAFLVGLHPRLRWLVIPWIAVVGFARVWFGAHWPSDAVVGGCLGWALGVVVCRGSWGVRLIDWMWNRVVDRNATPALPGLEAREREHR